VSDTQRRVEGSELLTYTDSVDGVDADDRSAFFVGWRAG
jgi:hypothetical protein